jgi:DNA modification methylase
MDGTIRSGGGSPGMISLPLSVDAPLLVQGDSFDVLDDLPAASIDVCITDPPAGIGFMAKPWDSFANYKPRTEQGRDIAARLGKDDLVRRAANLLLGLSLSTATESLPARDEAAELAALLRARSLAPAPLAPWAIGFVAFSVDIWTKVARVLKPGAFVVSWALPKTADLQALAMRCVGWTVTESCLHLFGGGMPKGKNISKAIDEMHGATREVVGSKLDLPGYHLSDSHETATALGGGVGMHADTSARLRASQITAPATDDARRWDGWNTQLAPGWEQYLIADTGRAGTYADQVLTHGTGAMHVDACRIARGEDTSRPNGKARGVYGDYNEGGMSASNPGGSWPRNVVLTHAAECDPGSCANGCPAGELDRQTGEQRDGVAVKRNGVRNDSTVAFAGPLPVGTPDQTYAGGGGASRFFTNLGYFPKAHARGAGIRVDITNRHPTIKNPDLTEWLTRLFAATSETTGGLPAVVLDPFAGSFTGAIAAIRSRVRFVGITLDAADVEVGRSRVAAAVGDPQAAIEANTLAPVGAQLSMI